MSQDSVKVLPMHSRSAMTLDEMRDEMVKTRPTLDGFRGGWASISNHESNLRRAGVEPPVSEPVIAEPTEALPRMLMARFYYWDPEPSGLRDQQDHNPLATRRLNAIDAMITEPAPGRMGILVSTRTPSYLGKTDGITAALNKILQTKDATIKIDRRQSHLRLADDEIFLWLAVQQRDNAQLAADVTLDQIAGISSRDTASRTADLRFGVDFDRANFLTAVAEKDTLGPIDICFVNHVGEENHSYEVRLHIDGGFEIRRNSLHFPDELDHPDLMLRTSLFLAYALIPRFNSLYVADSANWAIQRVEVIESAMASLEERYKSLRTALQKQLDAASE